MAREKLRLQHSAPPPAAPPPPPEAEPLVDPRDVSMFLRRLRDRMNLPLRYQELAQIERLEKLVGPGNYQGWCREGKTSVRDDRGFWHPPTFEHYAVDVLDADGNDLRFTGDTLLEALADAIHHRRNAHGRDAVRGADDGER